MSKSLLPDIHGPEDLRKLEIAQLPQVAEDIRHAICEQVSRTGGHLAPNLGVVELTIALHYVFDFSRDRLLFDVGHQCYPHKLLTGRQPLLSKLRAKGGMSGFPEPSESEFDLFSVGHAGTSISTAVGMARADTLLDQGDRRVVSMIGDASIVNGLAMEGLNNAGTLKRQFLVILNDNGMSIAKPQGALASSFDKARIHHSYGDFKKKAHEILERIPGGEALEGIYHRASEALKAAVFDGHFFSQFGLLCVGPADGHNLPDLIEILTEVKDLDRPLLLHCKTIKGKGFEPATASPTAFHSSKPFRLDGCRVEIKPSGRSFTAAFADAMTSVMERDDKIFTVTAAMPDGTGVDKLIEKFPERTLDTGICESHAMDMCAGMAKAGIKPFFAVYSTFAQRALDQVFQEVSLQGHPVRICMDRAGYVGGDGAVHHGFMDVAMFRPFPGAVILAASDEPNLVASLEFMREYEEGPSFLRYPRDSVAADPLQAEVPPFELGKANLVMPTREETPQIAVLAYGASVYESRKALAPLRAQGYDIALYDARFAKPVDLDLVRSLITSGVPILTIEEHSLTAGFGASILEACNDEGLSCDLISRMGMPERWIGQDSRSSQLSTAGLDAEAITLRIQTIIDDRDILPLPPPRENVGAVSV